MQGEYVMISREVLSASSISPCGPLNQPRGSEDMTQSNENHSPSSAICKPSSVAHSPKEFAAPQDLQGIGDNNKHLPEAKCEESRSGDPTVQQTKAVGSFTDKERSATSELPSHREPSLVGTQNGQPRLSSSPPPPPLEPSFSFPGVDTPCQFIQVQYSNCPPSDSANLMIRITPHFRNASVSKHAASMADYKEFEWLLTHGTSGVWYEKPTNAYLRSVGTPGAPQELTPLLDARPVSIETPKVWASKPTTTSIDDRILECVAAHDINEGYAESCLECTIAKSEALKNTPLVYCLVFGTYQARDPYIHASHFNGRQIYKLVKCGSREAVVAEAFYTAGIEGWSLVFSCVMKLGEGFEERSKTAKKVDKLWMLAEEDDDENNIKVFY
ncbi:hypothetical protein J4E82_011348 [Alternaria postmessia]|uniref:uncharacterized protein n=1 Tax=Alternaria postmessia TaxID=1187938 RepID=UPI002223F4D5|nr:uncharacterized protein J4E82_011348 [Alternaria postmessia]KAI5365616.1 hypothetical protein J4E82_011348 [Alternaria postmessia]